MAFTYTKTNTIYQCAVHLLRFSCKRSSILILLLGSFAALVLYFSQVIRHIFGSMGSAAWDGSSHQALAEIYSTSIFPNTFGWADTTFGGMPFPNFYPPAQVWLAALLHHSHLLSPGSAFKLAVLIPVLLLPLVFSIAALAISGRNTLAASSSVIISLFLLADSRFYLRFNSGIDLFSTFQLGLYAQALGFVLLALWLSIYLSDSQAWWKSGLSTITLALTILSHFFVAITAFVFVTATLLSDGWKCWQALGSGEFRPTVNRLLGRLAVVLVGVLLAFFWLAPVFSEYEYFVTRPNPVNLSRYFSPVLWSYCVVAAIGAAIWRRNPSSGMWPYLGGCGLLAVALVFSSAVAPEWFPLQAPRLLAILIFLLAVPAGCALAAAFRGLARLLGEIPGGNDENVTLISPQRRRERGDTAEKKREKRDFRQTLCAPSGSAAPLRWRKLTRLAALLFARHPPGKDQAVSLKRVRYTTGIALAILLVIAFTSPGTKIQYSFYTPEGFAEIARILEFAKGRRDGRYLVEVPPQRETRARFDGRAINAYLAAQGNETLSIAYHEASVNSLFFLPVVNTLSGAPYHFGISSVLGDDLDFMAQPVSKRLELARMIGARYLVIHTPQIKARLEQEPAMGGRQDFGEWSVFELKESPPPRARVLPYRPALVVSDFTVKERRRNESSFIRWAEEQFADGWFDVLLALAPERRIDRLPSLDGFGALVLDTYDCSDCDRAFDRLREFAGKRLLVALASDAPLFQRINAARSEFTKLEVVERRKEAPGERVNSSYPTYHYNSSQIRRQWTAIRRALDQNKIPTFAAPDNSSVSVPVETGKNSIKLNYAPVDEAAGMSEPAPILVATTFHPKWGREDGGMLYAATPFYMLTFADRPAALTFSRQWYDKAALWVSAITFAGLAFFTTRLFSTQRDKGSKGQRKQNRSSL